MMSEPGHYRWCELKHAVRSSGCPYCQAQDRRDAIYNLAMERLDALERFRMAKHNLRLPTSTGADVGVLIKARDRLRAVNSALIDACRHDRRVEESSS